MLTKAKLETTRNKLNALIAQFNHENPNFNVKLGRCSYTEFNATFKLEMSEVVGDKVMDKDRESFLNYAKLLGFEQSDIDREFTSNNEVFILSGYNSRAHKMPLVGKRKCDGTLYKFTVDAVLKALGKKEKGSDIKLTATNI